MEQQEKKQQELEDIREGIVEILFQLHPDIEAGNCHTLVDDRILDSFDIISLITQIREEFEVVVPAEQIVPHHFNSADALAKLVMKLMEEE